ncbi:unnamed protein product [Calypogeia fissa]
MAEFSTFASDVSRLSGSLRTEWERLTTNVSTMPCASIVHLNRIDYSAMTMIYSIVCWTASGRTVAMT